MERLEKRKTRKNRFNARFVLLLSCALILAVVVTFGVTLAFFGGASTGYSAEFILKSGIEFKENAPDTDYQSVTFDNDYMVPGTVLNALCHMTIVSGEADDIENTAVNGLVRTMFTLSGDMMEFLTLDDSDPIYVYTGSARGDMTDANKVARIVKADDNFYYIVGVDTAAITRTTLLYEVDCITGGGQVDLIFNIPIVVNNIATDGTEFTYDNVINKETSTELAATLTAKFQVIQSKYYSTSTTPDPQDYEHAKVVFDYAETQANQPTE